MSNPYQPPQIPAEHQPHRPPPEPGAVAYGVVVRSFGLFSVCYGASFLFMSFAYSAGVPEAEYGDNAVSLFYGVFLVCLGALLLAGARLIVKASYPGS